MKFAIFAEDETDAEALHAIVLKIVGDNRAPISKKGFGGQGNLLRALPREILNFEKKGATHFVICLDSDGKVPETIKAKVKSDFINKSPKHLNVLRGRRGAGT